MMTEMPAPESLSPQATTPEDRLIRYLVECADKDDRAALAALRRGLGRPPGAAPELFPHVARFFPMEPNRRYENAMLIVAALFGLHPRHQSGERSSLAVLRQLSRDNPNLDSPSTERRVLALLDADVETLPVHLRHLITLIRADPKALPLDYARLLRDIHSWDHPERFVQRRWARDWWGGIRNDPTDAIDATDDDDTSEEGAD